MKTKKFKRVLTLVLALAMMLSLSMVSFADNDPEVTVIVRYADYDLTEHEYDYSQLDSFNPTITAGDTVYDVILDEYGSDSVWRQVGTGANTLFYLQGITINNVDYLDIRYEAADSCFDEDDEYTYIGGDAIIDSLNELAEFIAHDGVDISYARLLDDDYYAGYYFMGDPHYSCAITYDWVYEVDYASDGYGNFVTPVFPGTDVQMTMNQCALSDGDIVRLTYGLTWVIWP